MAATVDPCAVFVYPAMLFAPAVLPDQLAKGRRAPDFPNPWVDVQNAQQVFVHGGLDGAHGTAQYHRLPNGDYCNTVEIMSNWRYSAYSSHNIDARHDALVHVSITAPDRILVARSPAVVRGGLRGRFSGYLFAPGQPGCQDRRGCDVDRRLVWCRVRQ